MDKISQDKWLALSRHPDYPKLSEYQKDEVVDTLTRFPTMSVDNAVHMIKLASKSTLGV